MVRNSNQKKKSNPGKPINENECQFFLVEELRYNGLEHGAPYQKCRGNCTEARGPLDRQHQSLLGGKKNAWLLVA